MGRYATAQDVADHLGVPLEGLPLAQADRQLGAAEAWIDAWARRTWGASAPRTEVQPVLGPEVVLGVAPVASVSAVAVRSAAVGAAWDALPASAYELLDAARGALLLPWGYAGWLVRVTYTPAQGAVPDDVRQAAVVLAAAWTRPVLDATAGGATAGPVVAKRLGDVEIRYATNSAATTGGTTTSATDGVPDLVRTLLAPYRQWVVA